MLAIFVIHLIAAVLVLACSVNSIAVVGFPLFAWCALLVFALQWLAFIPAFLRQTEKYYDLIGSLTYLSVVVLALVLAGTYDERSVLLVVAISVWALRLGSFLFRRIQADGHDSRFDKIKPDPVLFFRTWSLQGLWVLLTAGAALAAITGGAQSPLGLLDGLGMILWSAGFGIEVIADSQKRRFRAQHGSERFIDSGLWARSRHPNYFGEILLWFGIALLAFGGLQGWSYLALVSPLFVYALLMKVSGVPLLERKADRRWGEDPDYVAYKQRTPLLVPGRVQR